MSEDRITKKDAKYWIRRAREGLRDMEESLKTGDRELMDQGLLDASAAPEEVRAAYDQDRLNGFKPLVAKEAEE